MKIVITGHTRGLGKAIYDHFVSEGHEVIGLSRSNGFDINNTAIIVEQCHGTDLFINNAHCGTAQSDLIESLCGKVKIITCGSMGADYPSEGYRADKLTIQKTHQKHRKLTDIAMLLLKMGYLENYTDRQHIKYNTVLNSIDFWISNPIVSMIEVDNHFSKYQPN